MHTEAKKDIIKMQVEPNEAVAKDVAEDRVDKEITRETTWKEETQDPKNQECFKEEMTKGGYEASTVEREFPMRIADSHAKTRERSKDKEIEEAEEVAFKRKSKETEVLEFATKQKLQEPERGIIIQTLQEVPEEDKPEKPLEMRTPEREFQSTKALITHPKVVKEEFQENEQKQKTKLQPQKIQSKEAHEIEAVNQDTIKPKKRKEEGEESTRIGKAYHGRENSKEKRV
ncbi:hypothetical protein RJT34_02697 [Clitoria ternatea]|uniref:Uncharacterized protein n=1 Tax=Clitoria ternatea TaxID=43366 RepID=A0AAN9KJD9_CLITE